MTKKQRFNKKYFFVCLVFAFFVMSGCVKSELLNTGGRNSGTSNDNKPAGEVAILDGNVIVTKPVSNATVKNPLEISGRARVFEASVSYRVKDANGKILDEGFTTATAGAPAWGFYEIMSNFATSTTKTGFVEVLTFSAKDGSEQDLVSIPVTFDVIAPPKVKVFFSNIKEDPEILNCDIVYSVEREAQSPQKLVTSAISELLKGVTDEDVVEGFVSNLPENVKLKNLTQEGKKVTLDFSKELGEGVAGSCRVQAIVSQIEQTLLQFKGIEEVEILVDGVSSDISLQP